ncbi:MAG: hypothetical protein J6W80_07110, partial [Kiritimatiellae bacterium]|nr:hypothetical protein [Kiritimatiellia bacterium]
MKKIIMIAFAAVAAFAMAQGQQGRSSAGGGIKAKAGAAVAKVTTEEGIEGMKKAIAEGIGGLDAESQVAYVSAMNEAITALPGGDADKDAIFAAANDVALRNAAPGNVAKILAETFATVPAETLPAVTAALADTINTAAKAAGDNNTATIVAAAKNAVKEVEI